jgi:hypothetical protein
VGELGYQQFGNNPGDSIQIMDIGAQKRLIKQMIIKGYKHELLYFNNDTKHEPIQYGQFRL